MKHLQFKERANHAWLCNGHELELFIRRPLEAIGTTDGALTCKVFSSQMEEIREDSAYEPTSVFLVVPTPRDTKVYKVKECVTYIGGDALLFIEPVANFN